MDRKNLAEAKMLSEGIAARYGTPRFYLEKEYHVSISRRLIENNRIVKTCIGILAAVENNSGHGLSHAQKVAIDAGAIVLIERETLDRELIERRVSLAHIAGILHDIKRSSVDHALHGAEMARGILASFDLRPNERKDIVDAIRNHEAFQPFKKLEDPDARLLSDALYDADKFRWGPDNFTEMVWDIAEIHDISMEKLLSHFPSGLQSLSKIKDTFRSSTGKEYGPFFIDMGIKIGENLYARLEDEYLPNPSKLKA